MQAFRAPHQQQLPPRDLLYPRSGAGPLEFSTHFSMRIAVALNSDVPDFGSTASIVRSFVNLIVKMHRKKCQAGPQAGVKPHRREHRATAGTDAHLFSFADLVALAVFERKVQCRRAAV